MISRLHCWIKISKRLHALRRVYTKAGPLEANWGAQQVESSWLGVRQDVCGESQHHWRYTHAFPTGWLKGKKWLPTSFWHPQQNLWLESRHYEHSSLITRVQMIRICVHATAEPKDGKPFFKSHENMFCFKWKAPEIKDQKVLVLKTSTWQIFSRIKRWRGITTSVNLQIQNPKTLTIKTQRPWNLQYVGLIWIMI